MADITGIRISQLPPYDAGAQNKIDEADLSTNFLVIDDQSTTNGQGSRSISLETIVNSLEKASVESIDWSKVDGKPAFLGTIENSVSTLEGKVTTLEGQTIPQRSSADIDAGGDGTYVGAAYVQNLINDSAASTATDKTWSVNKINSALSAAGKIQSISKKTDDTVMSVDTSSAGAVTIGHKKDYLTSSTTKGDNSTASTSTFKVPKITADTYGHVTALSELEITVPTPAAPGLATSSTAGLVKANSLSSTIGYSACQINNGILYSKYAYVGSGTLTTSGSAIVTVPGASSTMDFELFTEPGKSVNITAISVSGDNVTLTYDKPDSNISIKLVGHNY